MKTFSLMPYSAIAIKFISFLQLGRQEPKGNAQLSVESRIIEDPFVQPQLSVLSSQVSPTEQFKHKVPRGNKATSTHILKWNSPQLPSSLL
jgi:hypothetical protein